jgi:hypothetical protein
MQDGAETKTSPTIAGTSRTSLSATSTSSGDERQFVPGTLIAGRYRIISLLGRGGMGKI